MLTNLLGSIIVCLVTNTAEQIIKSNNNGYTYAIPNLQVGDYWNPPPVIYKYVITDINEMKLLVVEFEGRKLTNTLSNILKSRTREYYHEKTLPAVWEKREDMTIVETNFPVWYITNWISVSNIGIISTNWITNTNLLLNNSSR